MCGVAVTGGIKSDPEDVRMVTVRKEHQGPFSGMSSCHAMHVERALGVRGSAGGIGGLMPLNYIPKCGEGGGCCLHFTMLKRQDKNWCLSTECSAVTLQ